MSPERLDLELLWLGHWHTPRPCMSNDPNTEHGFCTALSLGPKLDLMVKWSHCQGTFTSVLICLNLWVFIQRVEWTCLNGGARSDAMHCQREGLEGWPRAYLASLMMNVCVPPTKTPGWIIMPWEWRSDTGQPGGLPCCTWGRGQRPSLTIQFSPCSEC